ncbi:MAG TPA: ABC-type transport auxiliary lipoprotein family protein [Thermodesulfobacteriota bacterium]|jgi:cholesterol transport system auxiliary component
MILKHYGYIWLIVFNLLILNLGCVGLQKNYPERKYYVFDVTPSNNYNESSKHSVLEIRNFRVSPAYYGNEFVYRVSGDGYESDFYNQFFKSPASLITQEAFKWFSQASAFKYVVVAPSEVPPDYILDGYINSIYGDYSDTGLPKAVLSAQLFLIKEDSGKNSIVFNKSYQKVVDITSQSPTALVNGWNEALNQTLTELESDLSKLNLEASQ